jgi:hypothetical protein
VSSGLNKDCKPYQIKWTADDGPTYPSYTGDKGGLAYACLALIVEYDTISLGAMVRAESRAVEENLEKESRAEARLQGPNPLVPGYYVCRVEGVAIDLAIRAASLELTLELKPDLDDVARTRIPLLV